MQGGELSLMRLFAEVVSAPAVAFGTGKGAATIPASFLVLLAAGLTPTQQGLPPDGHPERRVAGGERIPHEGMSD